MALISRQGGAVTGRLRREDEERERRYPKFGVPRPNLPIPDKKEKNLAPKSSSKDQILGTVAKVGTELGKAALNKYFGSGEEKKTQGQPDPLAGLRQNSSAPAMQRLNQLTQSENMNKNVSALSKELGFGGDLKDPSQQQSQPDEPDEERSQKVVEDFQKTYNEENFSDKESDLSESDLRDRYDSDFSSSFSSSGDGGSDGGGGK